MVSTRCDRVNAASAFVEGPRAFLRGVARCGVIRFVPDLLRLKVLESAASNLKLRVRLLPAHEGQFCTSRDFVWMMIDPRLNAAAFKKLDQAAVRRAVARMDDLSDASPASSYAEVVIESVTVHDVVRYSATRDRAAWEAAAEPEELYPEAIYTVQLTEPGLAAFLPVGFSVDSSAYDPTGSGKFFVPYPL